MAPDEPQAPAYLLPREVGGRRSGGRVPSSPYLNTSRAPSGRFRSEVYVRGRRYHLGYWATPEDAARAAAIARTLLPEQIRPKRHRVMVSAPTSISSAHERALRRRVVERLAAYDPPNPQPRVETTSKAAPGL